MPEIDRKKITVLFFIYFWFKEKPEFGRIYREKCSFRKLFQAEINFLLIRLI